MKSAKCFFTDILFYAVGCGVYSAAIVIFTEPNMISPGGITGIATLLNHLIGVPIGTTALLLNVPLLIMGFRAFGGKFIIGTAIATVILSLMLDIMQLILKPYYTDGILAALFGGIMMGAGLSLVMLRGATTGGADIVAKLVNQKYKFVSIGRVILGFDFAVVAASALVYKNFQSALYSIVSLYASSKVIDSLLYGSGRGKLIYTITDKAKEISDEILKNLGRGVTIIPATGGYTGNNRSMLMCAVRTHEVARIQSIVKNTDEHAFVVISDAGEIMGEGFTKI